MCNSAISSFILHQYPQPGKTNPSFSYFLASSMTNSAVYSLHHLQFGMDAWVSIKVSLALSYKKIHNMQTLKLFVLMGDTDILYMCCRKIWLSGLLLVSGKASDIRWSITYYLPKLMLRLAQFNVQCLANFAEQMIVVFK
jgi:hypothetical protein